MSDEKPENEAKTEAASAEVKPSDPPKAEEKAKPSDPPKAEAKPSDPPKTEAKPSEAPKAEEKAKPSDPPKAEEKAKPSEAPKAALSAHDGAAHGSHAGHGAGDDHGHGLAHTMPISLLVGVLAALMALTVLTVSVTHYDLGSEGNLVVAMIIATVKAGLVVTFFMHLLWDKKFHLILFLTAILFVVLFLSMSITDRGEYQPRIDDYATKASP